MEFKSNVAAIAFVAAIYVVVFVVGSADVQSDTKQSPKPRANPETFTGTPLKVWTDPKARYWISSTPLSPEGYRIITTRRVGSSGESYSVRVADCTFTDNPPSEYLSSEDTLADAKRKANEAILFDFEDVFPLTHNIRDSISDIVTRAACEGIGESPGS